MAKAEVDLTNVKYVLNMSYEEAVVLRELLWFTQLGRTGKGHLAYNLAEALNDAGLDPEKNADWSSDLNRGRVINLDNDETGLYWT